MSRTAFQKGLGARLACGALLLALTAPLAPARADLLYDLDFSTPPHAVGLPPVIGSGPAPRETVTDIPFGDPRVAATFGPLNDQPLRFDTADGVGDQIELDVEDLATCGTYTFDCDLLVAVCNGNQQLSFHFDTPEVRNVYFDGAGNIHAFVPGQVIGVIGAYALGAVVHLEVVIDLPADLWTITVDGVQLHAGPFDATTLAAVRVSTQVAPPVALIRAAIDDLTLDGTDCLDAGTCNRIDFSDVPFGVQYHTGDAFFTSGVTVSVTDLWTDIGACAGSSTSGGFTEASNTTLACQVRREMNVNNVTLNFDFGGTVTDVLIPFGEYGGTVSLSINDSCVVAENFEDLSGTVLGGVLITVFTEGTPGQSCGVIRLGGDVDELAIGGQELYVDGITYCPKCEDIQRSAFEDQVNGTTYFVGDTFTSGAATHELLLFYFPDSTCAASTAAGLATIGNAREACSDGREIELNNINDRIDFGETVDRLLLAFGEYGGNVNLEINGDCRNAANFSDLSNQIIGGVYVGVEEYGTPGQSCGALYALGPIETFKIGGQELWIDNVRACAPAAVGVGQPSTPDGAHGLVLEASRPNPLRTGTSIAFTLPEAGQARLTIFDVSGRAVRTLVAGALDAGEHGIFWDGTNDRGQRVAPGFYAYRLEVGALSSARRLVVLP